MAYSPALLPVAKIYGAAVAVRNLLYDSALIKSKGVPLPVISVGNITVGGSGKSPFTQLVVEQLTRLGRSPVILLRGYGGSACGPQIVRSSDSAEAVGDEALMHLLHFGGKVPVVIARRRVEGAQMIVSEALGDAIVLDDGFQHRRLARDLDLLLVDLSDESKRTAWERGALLPAGPLREPRKSALKRVSAAVFLMRGEKQVEDFDRYHSLLSLAGELRKIRVIMTVVDFVDLFSGEKQELGSIKGTLGSAVAAIAFPEPFFEMLRESGIELASTVAFPDHYQYGELDWKRIKASSSGPIFVTEKDAVKLRPFVNDAKEVFVMRVGCEFVTTNELQDFGALLSRCCDAKSLS